MRPGIFAGQVVLAVFVDRSEKARTDASTD